jgi:hypothetical protein
MVCIAVALARAFPRAEPALRLTEYGALGGETVNRDKHLGPGPAPPVGVGGP